MLIKQKDCEKCIYFDTYNQSCDDEMCEDCMWRLRWVDNFKEKDEE